VGRPRKYKLENPSSATVSALEGDSQNEEKTYRVFFEDRFELVSAGSEKEAIAITCAVIGRKPDIKKVEKI
jgi:hypothetical protein